MSAVNHIKEFKAPSRLRSEALKITLKFIDEEKIKELKEVFMSLDTRQTGFITALDLEKAFVDLGLDTAANEIKKMIEELSFLTEGKINYTEFLIATLNYKT